MPDPTMMEHVTKEPVCSWCPGETWAEKDHDHRCSWCREHERGVCWNPYDAIMCEEDDASTVYDRWLSPPLRYPNLGFPTEVGEGPTGMKVYVPDLHIADDGEVTRFPDREVGVIYWEHRGDDDG